MSRQCRGATTGVSDICCNNKLGRKANGAKRLITYRDNRLAFNATRKIEGDEVDNEKLDAAQASPSLLGVSVPTFEEWHVAKYGCTYEDTVVPSMRQDMVIIGYMHRTQEYMQEMLQTIYALVR